MQHLDEGLIMALLDGELSAVERREVDGHLVSCAECTRRLAEARDVIAEADGLVEQITVPPATVRADVSRPRSRWVNGRNLAWAASVVAALGLGVGGSVVFMRQAEQGSDVAVAPQPAEAPRDEGTPPPTDVPSAFGSLGQASAEVGPGQAAGDGPPANQARPSTARAEVDRAREQLATETTIGTNAFEETSQANLSVRGERLDSNRAETETLADAAGRAAEAPAGASRLRSRPQAALAAPPPLVPRDEVSSKQRLDSGFRPDARVFRGITMEEAVRHLGGAIRLVDGLTPEEFEIAAADSAQPVVRVLYRVGPTETTLFLEQRRADNSFVASDLQMLQPSVERSITGNSLSWKDLGGFVLTLSGPISADSLFHFKTLVK